MNCHREFLIDYPILARKGIRQQDMRLYYLLWSLVSFLLLASAKSVPKIARFDPGPPVECVFDRKGIEYEYEYFVGGIEGTACVGWSGPSCGSKPHEREDLQEAVRQQATKDGQFVTVQVGRWIAGFQLFTTAFADRNTTYFDYVLSKHEYVGWSHWFYSRNKNFMVITTSEC